MRIKYMFVLLITVTAATLLYLVLSAGWLDAGESRGTEQTPDRAKGGPVPVSIITIAPRDVPIYLSGIGTVQAYNAVAVKTRVDGQITQILFQEGQEVKAGDPLVVIDPRPFNAQLEQQQAALQKDTALLDNAELDLRRYENLATKNYTSQQQLDTQRALVSQSKAQVAADQAQVKYAQIQLEWTTITSPINGRIGVRQIDVGNVVHNADNAVIASIVQYQPISVIMSLPAKDLASSHIMPGLVDLPVLAYASDRTTLIGRGNLSLVDNVVDQATGTIKLKATFDNADQNLWPGNYVDCRIVIENRHDGITVPPPAMRHGTKGDFVWVVGPDNIAEARGVAVRQNDEEGVLIDKGLKPGERVVVNGQYRLIVGGRVTIVPTSETATPRADNLERDPT
jgi:membrane fusion protein, multidrug efflux system